jgi:hypothetical protein
MTTIKMFQDTKKMNLINKSVTKAFLSTTRVIKNSNEYNLRRLSVMIRFPRLPINKKVRLNDYCYD